MFVHSSKQQAVLEVAAAWYRERGHTVEVNTHPTHRHLYVDGKQVDVIGSTKAFTGHEDFPYDSIWVCAASRYEAIKPYVTGFVTVNEPMTHGLLVDPATTRAYWKLEYRRNLHGVPEDVFMCPIELTQVLKFRAASDNGNTPALHTGDRGSTPLRSTNNA